MLLLSLLSRAFISIVSAESVDKIGEGSPGVSEMWSIIRGTFPGTGAGEDAAGMISRGVNSLVLQLIGGVAVAMVIYAGLRMVYGSEEGYGEAKKILKYTIIGVILALIADAILNMVYAIIMNIT